ncbi:MAG TPA: hypothetical protein VGX28_11960 [Frankiaceae bacterium]|jgi:hypothetical protein|nr:hypothetical protein [Frankiaceae bacterium]
MSLSDEVRDPWSYVVGGLAGGMAFAVGIFPPAAVAIGAAVLGVKVVSGALTNRGQRRAARRREKRLPVITRTPEAAWLNRAEEAVDQFHDIAYSASDGPIADRVQTFGMQTEESIATLQRLAGQASAVRLAIARIDPRRLQFERDRLMQEHNLINDPGVRTERERSVKSVQAQLETYQRLAVTLTTLLAKLEAGALAIEGLVARLAEVVALATSSGTSGGETQVDELAQELEGLRAGLVETEGVTTRTIEGLAPLPEAAPGSVPQAGTEPGVRRRATD